MRENSDGSSIVEWYSTLQGQPVATPRAELPTNIAQEIQNKIVSMQSLLGQLQQQGQISNEQFQLLDQAIKGLNYSDSQVYLINGSPTIVGWGMGKAPEKPIPVAPIAPVAAATSAGFFAKHRCCLAALLLALLALLGLLAWWFWIKPTWFDKPAEQPVAEQIKEDLVKKTEEVAIPPAQTETNKVEEVRSEEVKVPPQEIKAVNAPVAPVCNKTLVPEKRPQMVMIFDNSGSMMYSLNETQDSLRRWEMHWEEQGGVLDSEWSYVTREPRRLTVAKKAASSIIDKIDNSIDVGLITLDYCPGATYHDFYSPGKRNALKNKIKKLKPSKTKGGTPLLSGLQTAARMVDGVSREAFILLVSDGEDTCGVIGEDVCSIAKHISETKPLLKINVVDIGNAQAANCAAEITEGKVFSANNKAEVVDMINQAIQPMMEVEECK